MSYTCLKDFHGAWCCLQRYDTNNFKCLSFLKAFIMSNSIVITKCNLCNSTIRLADNENCTVCGHDLGTIKSHSQSNHISINSYNKPVTRIRLGWTFWPVFALALVMGKYEICVMIIGLFFILKAISCNNN